MNAGRLMAVLTIVLVLSMTTVGGAFAAPALQLGEARVGVFGTVSAILDDSIVLDGGKIVGTNSNTRVLVPAAEEANLEDISSWGSAGHSREGAGGWRHISNRHNGDPIAAR